MDGFFAAGAPEEGASALAQNDKNKTCQVGSASAISPKSNNFVSFGKN
jgi:hypothetical protein